MDNKQEMDSLDLEFVIKDEPDSESERNPWSVQSLEDFLHYCCPECDAKSQSKELFVNHAIQEHPDAVGTLSQFVTLSDYQISTKEEQEQEDFAFAEDIEDLPNFDDFEPESSGEEYGGPPVKKPRFTPIKSHSKDPNLPEHMFDIRPNVTKKGRKEGALRNFVSLIIPPYVFKKKSGVKSTGKVSFICNGCHKLGHYTYASAIKSLDKDDNETYTLKTWPDEHVCSPTKTDHLVQQFRKALYDSARMKSNRSIPECYNEVKKDFLEDIESEADKSAFLNDAPTFESMKVNLYRARREVQKRTKSKSLEDYDDGSTDSECDEKSRKSAANLGKRLTCEDSPLPEHSFDFRQHTSTSGPLKGEVRTFVKLVIPPYVFNKNKVYDNGKVTFTCQSCGLLGVGNYASAKKSVDKDGVETYSLKSWPEKHVCSPSKVFHLVQRFRFSLTDAVQANTEKPIREIYDEVKDHFVKDMPAKERDLFLGEAQSYNSVMQALHKTRKDLHHLHHPEDIKVKPENEWHSSSNRCSRANGDEVPEHKFDYDNQAFQSGKLKGQERTRVSLIMPPYVFCKNKNHPTRVTFACNGCSKIKVRNYAFANKHIDKDGVEHLELCTWPKHHACSPTKKEHLVKELRQAVYANIRATPSKPAVDLYYQTLNDITSNLSVDEKEAFLKVAPTFEHMKGNIYKMKRECGWTDPSKDKKQSLGLDYNAKDNRHRRTDGHGVPDHHFQVRQHKNLSGPQFGEVRNIVTLMMPPFVFSRNKDSNAKVTFNCRGCARINVANYAFALKSVDEQGNDQLTLSAWPIKHACMLDPPEGKIKTEPKHESKPNIKPVEKTMLCPQCGDRFVNNQRLQVHIKAKHEGVKDLTCEYCDYKTYYGSTLKSHIERRHLRSNTYYCDQCSFKTHAMESLRRHVRHIHEKVKRKTFNCDTCDSSFSGKRHLVKHKSKVHGCV